MNKYEKYKRKEEIKEKGLKILHVVSYILSICFIVLMVIVGAQSCASKPQKVSAEEEVNLRLQPRRLLDPNATNVYYFNFVGQTYFDINFSQQYFLSRGNSSLTQSYASAQSSFQVYVDLLGSTGYFADGDTSYAIDRMIIEFSTYENSNNRYEYRVSSVGFNYNNYTSYLPMLVKNDNTATSYRYDVTTNYVIQFVVSEDVVLDELFFFFYSSSDKLSFVFNKEWNYNAPINTTIDGVYGSGTFSYTGPDSAYMQYDTGFFVSNGSVYNSIKIWYFKTGAIDALVENQQRTPTITRLPSGFYVYGMMEYNNTITSNSITVNIHDQIPYTTSGGGSTFYYANTSTWKNDSFRYITFLEPLSSDLLTKINALNNNNQNSVSGYVGSGEITDVFSLVGSAFTALVPILGIMVLPNITLGVLIFIPLVAMLVFAIIRIIKK